MAVIYWQDTRSYSSWKEDNTEDSPVALVTVGIIKNLDENKVTIVTTTSPEDMDLGNACMRLSIPMGCVTEIEEIPYRWKKHEDFKRRKVQSGTTTDNSKARVQRKNRST
jgi:hypothetical protein